MSKENIEKLESALTRLDTNESVVYFLTYDTKNNPRASVKHIYDLALVLKNNGITSKILVEDNTYGGVSAWLDEKYTNIPVVSIKDDKPELKIDDILVVPEYYSNALQQLANVRCVKIMLLQQKDYMFETACVSIIRDELDNHEEDLLTRPFVRDLLKHMGCYTRYNDNTTVIERIVTKVLDALKDPEKVVGQLTINNNEEDVDRFIAESDEWQQHNTENDQYKFVVIPLQDNISFAFTYAERLLTTVCKNEAEDPKVTVEGTLPPKVTKVLLWNKENSNNAKKIVASRIKFKEKLNQGWQTRRDNVLAPIENILNPTIVDSYRKKLSDLNLEIWCMNQLDDEDEPFEMAFDTEE
jgi:hypothetical protein